MRIQGNSGFIGAVVALVLLAVPAVATLLDIVSGPDDVRAEGIARTPLLSSGLARFAADTRFYVKQRFATKDQLITLNSLVKTEVFSSSPYAKVIQGEDGFLFLADDEAIDYHQHTELFSTGDLAAWREALIGVDKRLAARGVRYQLFVAPNKHSVHTDKLPIWANQRRHSQSRLEQLSAVLRDTGVGVSYPLEALVQGIHQFPGAVPFFKTDTHWNEFGGGLAAAELLRDLGLPVEHVIRPQAYHPDKAGDLARMIGQQTLVAEQGWTLPDELLKADCVKGDGSPFVNRETDPLRFDRVRCTGGRQNGLKVLVFMDSFGVGLVPSLGAAFEEAVFVWSYRLDESLVEQIKPDFVIHQLVERKLQTLAANDLFGER